MSMLPKRTATVLESIYRRFCRRDQAAFDPVHFLYEYPDAPRREVAGLVASCLAYGRVMQICKSVADALDRIGLAGCERFEDVSEAHIRRSLAGFKHRFTTGDQLAGLLIGARRAQIEHGSLQACFRRGLEAGAHDVVDATGRFVDELNRLSGACAGHLLPHPAAGSACKRLNLYLRWMVRRDEVDPGGWDGVGTELLVIPMDVHMHRLSLRLGLTRRRAADMRSAREATAGFAAADPMDPVKYDFALTRMSIVDPAGLEALISERGRS
jgi:uncharacterized protein (TIGR02757 family)